MTTTDRIFNTKLGMIAASNDWPDLIVEGGIRNQQDDLIVGDKVWELSSYIEQYLPDLFRHLSHGYSRQLVG
ncbi:MAG: hypothetical protein ACLR23_00275 [Clostridia bacterium]